MLEATLRKDTKTMEKLIQEAHDINIRVILNTECHINPLGT